MQPDSNDRTMSGTPPSDDDDDSRSASSTDSSSNVPADVVPTIEAEVVSSIERKSFMGVFIHAKPVAPQLPYSSLRTGLIYDPRMRFHTEKEIEEDDDIHPEDPRRIYEIYHELKNAGLIAEEDVDPADARDKLLRIPCRPANPDEICLVHSMRHYYWMENLSCTF
jgi:histone deacetylase 6